jgi:hypothetical protein
MKTVTDSRLGFDEERVGWIGLDFLDLHRLD